MFMPQENDDLAVENGVSILAFIDDGIKCITCATTYPGCMLSPARRLRASLTYAETGLLPVR